MKAYRHVAPEAGDTVAMPIGITKGSLRKEHIKLKAIRSRGTETPSYMAARRFLADLDKELHRVADLLDEAWKFIDCRDFRKCSHHADRAQQRLHKVIRKLERKCP